MAICLLDSETQVKYLAVWKWILFNYSLFKEVKKETKCSFCGQGKVISVGTAPDVKYTTEWDSCESLTEEKIKENQVLGFRILSKLKGDVKAVRIELAKNVLNFDYKIDCWFKEAIEVGTFPLKTLFSGKPGKTEQTVPLALAAKPDQKTAGTLKVEITLGTPGEGGNFQQLINDREN